MVAGIQVVVDLERTGNEEGEDLGALEALDARDGPEVQEVQEAQEDDDDLFVDEIVVQAQAEVEAAVRELVVEDAIVELAVEVHEMEEAAAVEVAVAAAVEDVHLELQALTYLLEERSDFHLNDSHQREGAGALKYKVVGLDAVAIVVGWDKVAGSGARFEVD